MSDDTPASARQGETDLVVLLRGMRPHLLPGEWFFGTVRPGTAVDAAATVREPEGLSVLVDRAEADRLGLDVSSAFRWITLQVHSSLEAVGLTAAVSRVLTAHGISCNVVAGAYHDHLLVPAARANDAMAALAQLSR